MPLRCPSTSRLGILIKMGQKDSEKKGVHRWLRLVAFLFENHIAIFHFDNFLPVMSVESAENSFERKREETKPTRPVAGSESAKKA